VVPFSASLIWCIKIDSFRQNTKKGRKKMYLKNLYKDHLIEKSINGLYSCSGGLKADTLKGLKKLIDEKEGKNDI